MTTLCCHRVWFYSPADERMFFEFIKQIKAVRRIECVGEDVFLHVKSSVSEKSLRDLNGLFKRYGVSATELKKLNREMK
jgi:hypothetical protein